MVYSHIIQEGIYSFPVTLGLLLVALKSYTPGQRTFSPSSVIRSAYNIVFQKTHNNNSKQSLLPQKQGFFIPKATLGFAPLGAKVYCSGTINPSQEGYVNRIDWTDIWLYWEQ